MIRRRELLTTLGTGAGLNACSPQNSGNADARPTMECMVNRDAYEGMPDDLKAVVRIACQAANLDMTAEFNARNASALEQLRSDPSIEIRSFPEDVLARLKALTLQVINELAARDTLVRKVWESYGAFLRNARSWQQISEQGYVDTTGV
jgi:TRAP-type mannitol/chloroaromatic compound transport system substrate-binding protein